MLTILSDRQSAKDLAAQIQAWREANVPHYNATSWANCELSDADYDVLYKHQSQNLWYVPLPDDYLQTGIDCGTPVDSLPDGWKPVVEGIGE